MKIKIYLKDEEFRLDVFYQLMVFVLLLFYSFSDFSWIF